jgi:hypothetical protein
MAATFRPRSDEPFILIAKFVLVGVRQSKQNSASLKKFQTCYGTCQPYTARAQFARMLQDLPAKNDSRSHWAAGVRMRETIIAAHDHQRERITTRNCHGRVEPA